MSKWVFIVLFFLFVALACFNVYNIYNADKEKPTPALTLRDISIDDLYGKQVSVGYNQMWPFDPTQNIQVGLVSQREIEPGLVAAVVNVYTIAEVVKDEKKKDFPEKVELSGLIRITYERIGDEWYTVDIQNLRLRVTPVKKH